MIEGMDKHGNPSGNIAQEDNSSEIAKDVLSDAAKTGTDLTFAVVASLALGDGKGLASRALHLGLDKVLFFLGVEDRVPGRKGNEGNEKNQRVDILGIAKEDIGQGEVLGTAGGGKGATNVVGRRVVSQHFGKLRREKKKQQVSRGSWRDGRWRKALGGAENGEGGELLGLSRAADGGKARRRMRDAEAARVARGCVELLLGILGSR